MKLPSVDEVRAVTGCLYRWYGSFTFVESPFFSTTGDLKDFTPLELYGFMRPRIGEVNANPGLPFSCHAENVLDVLENHLPSLTAAVKERLTARLTMDPHLTAWGKFNAGLRDLVSLFVKNEPTKVTKVALSQQRLISNPSFIDRVCDEIVWYQHMDYQLQNWRVVPSKPGLGLDDPNLVDLRAGAPRPCYGYTLVSTDAKRWDWSVRLWLALLCFPFLFMQVTLSVTGNWAVLALNSLYCGFDHLMVDGYGNIHDLPPGTVMETGWLLTAFLNSLMRVTLYILAHLRAFGTVPTYACMAMGDDCVELCPEGRWDDLADAYASLGFTIERAPLKEWVEFEFCSQDFYPDAVIPQHGDKMMYALLSKKPDAFLLAAFKYELRADPLLNKRLALLQQVGWNPQ